MKWLHNILKGASLTGALFVFQACYGMPVPPSDSDFASEPSVAIGHADDLLLNAENPEELSTPRDTTLADVSALNPEK